MCNRGVFRSLIQLLSLATLTAFGSACFHSNIHTIDPPVERLSGTTYRFLTATAVRYGAPVSDASDPMFPESSAHRLIKQRIASALASLGYRPDTIAPDIDVAFYASVRPEVDLTRFWYGYDFVPDWPRWPVPRTMSETDGQVVVDLLRAGTPTLLWRGEGSKKLGRNSDENIRNIAALAGAIAGKAPSATRRHLVASGPAPQR